MITLLTCAHCGFKCKGLTLHLKYKHNQAPKEYRAIYPAAEIFSSSVRKQMKNNNHLANNPSSLEERYGKEKADEIKTKIGEKSGKSRLGKARPGQSETIKKTWETNREAWSLGIRTHAQTPEAREKQRQAMKKRITEHGYHLARGKETRFEKFAREALTQNQYEVIKQKSTKQIPGTTRFFDIWVPALNLVIECDGEYWHCRFDRIKIDFEKNAAARADGIKLLRISDKEFSRKFDKADTEKFIMLLSLSAEELESRAFQLVQNRLLKLNAKIIP